MTENGYIDSYRKIESGRELLKTFGLNKAILLDPKISASLNIATTLAGIKGLLIANDNRIVEEFGWRSSKISAADGRRTSKHIMASR
jgi:hypothetical protein